MTIYFPDLSAWDVPVAVQPDTVAVIARATLSTTDADPLYATYRRQASQAGAVFAAYHWLNEDLVDEQAGWAWRHVGPGVPLMIDAEDVSGNTGFTRHLTVDHITAFAAAYRALGGTVHLVYLPRWYWHDDMGAPDLTPLARAGLSLVASDYSQPYSDTAAGWAPYGGLAPAVLQYTNRQRYGGQLVDFNAFRGSLGGLRALMYGTPTGGPMFLGQVAGDPAIYYGTGVDHRHVRSVNDLGRLQAAIQAAGGDPTVKQFTTVDDMWGVLGYRDADAPPAALALEGLTFTVTATQTTTHAVLPAPPAGP